MCFDVSEFGVKDDVRFCEWMAEYVGVAKSAGFKLLQGRCT